MKQTPKEPNIELINRQPAHHPDQDLFAAILLPALAGKNSYTCMRGDPSRGAHASGKDRGRASGVAHGATRAIGFCDSFVPWVFHDSLGRRYWGWVRLG